MNNSHAAKYTVQTQNDESCCVPKFNSHISRTLDRRAVRGRYHRGNYCCQGRVRFNYLRVYMNVSVNDTLTLTRLSNREEPSCIQSVVELCPARDRRPIKNATLQNELDSAAATAAVARAASVVMTLEQTARSLRQTCASCSNSLMQLLCRVTAPNVLSLIIPSEVSRI